MNRPLKILTIPSGKTPGAVVGAGGELQKEATISKMEIVRQNKLVVFQGSGVLNCLNLDYKGL